MSLQMILSTSGPNMALSSTEQRIVLVTPGVPIPFPFAAIASQAEAEAGNDNTKGMSPLRTKQSIAALQLIKALASQAEAEAGVENNKGMTPLRVAQAIAALGGGGGGGNRETLLETIIPNGSVLSYDFDLTGYAALYDELILRAEGIRVNQLNSFLSYRVSDDGGETWENLKKTNNISNTKKFGYCDDAVELLTGELIIRNIGGGAYKTTIGIRGHNAYTGNIYSHVDSPGFMEGSVQWGGGAINTLGVISNGGVILTYGFGFKLYGITYGT